MRFIRLTKAYKPKSFYLKYFLKTFWFIPSDALQRGMEANIWDLCVFKSPVLDIGIGNGALSKLLFRKHAQMAVGIDIESSGLQQAKATQKYKKVLLADAKNMPFKDASFNTVVSNSTFEHIKADVKALSEVARVLKKGGLFFITVPSIYLKKWILDYEEKKNKDIAKINLSNFNKRTQHFHYRSYKEWKENFQKNNMEVVFHKYYFSKNVARFWYKLFNMFTFKIKNRELWSYMGQSQMTKYMPKNLIIALLEKFILKNSYNKAFFTDSEPGAQLFIIAKKI